MFIVTDVAPYPDGPAGVHGVLPQAAVALAELAGLASLEARAGDVVSPTIDPAALAGGGVLALFTIGETPWSGAQRAAITDGVRSGRLGILGVHAATDACAAWEEYGSLVGARFDGHPWTETFDIDVVDVAHPSTRHLGRRVAVARRGLPVPRPAARRPRPAPRGRGPARHERARGAPPARSGSPWRGASPRGTGRVFYTSLGHFPGAWETPAYLRHLQGGLAWVLGDGD